MVMIHRGGGYQTVEGEGGGKCERGNICKKGFGSHAIPCASGEFQMIGSRYHTLQKMIVQLYTCRGIKYNVESPHE